ncbi:hypothetical protein [Enterococcus hirae]|uniref:hypothetical protein n=1 Tax=Enterococcus hirae TaxID=1354 RepID=UPI0015F296F7|nr:hypothetical protein [Enterococcus hirae]MBA5256812.1 hypothetical protein [Enterococcus hirae]
METLEQRKQRKARKKLEMQRLCRLLDVERWEHNESIVNEVRAIVRLGKTPKKETNQS